MRMMWWTRIPCIRLEFLNLNLCFRYNKHKKYKKKRFKQKRCDIECRCTPDYRNSLGNRPMTDLCVNSKEFYHCAKGRSNKDQSDKRGRRRISNKSLFKIKNKSVYFTYRISKLFFRHGFSSRNGTRRWTVQL